MAATSADPQATAQCIAVLPERSATPDVRAAFQQRLDHVFAGERRGREEGRLAAAVSRLDRRAPVEQESHRLDVARHRCLVQRCAADLVLSELGSDAK